MLSCCKEVGHMNDTLKWTGIPFCRKKRKRMPDFYENWSLRLLEQPHKERQRLRMLEGKPFSIVLKPTILNTILTITMVLTCWLIPSN